MKLRDYQIQSMSTAVYPEELKLIYPAMGLAGEIGEVCNKLKKVFRDNHGTITPVGMVELAKEVGDCIWYVAAVATDAGLTLSELYTARSSNVTLVMIPLRLAVCVGRVTQIVSQAVEDPEGVRLLAQPLERIGNLLSQLCWMMGTSLNQVAEMNRQKLLDRQARGTLQGSGDNR